MAANDYLKAAAAQLRRAAGFLQQQAKDLMSERDRTASQRSSEINRHQIDLKATQAGIPTQSDDRVKAALEIHSREIRKQIDSKKEEVKQVNNQLSDAARAKQQAAQLISDKAHELEQQAASPDFN